MQATLTDNTPTSLVNISNLISTTHRITSSITIAHFSVNPYNPQWVVLDVQDSATQQHLWLSYNQQTKTSHLLLATNSRIHTVDYSANGDWLTIGGISDLTTNKEKLIVDLMGQHAQPYSSDYTARLSRMVWSADGNWTIRIEKHFIALHAPAYDYTHIFAPNQAPCTVGGWVD